MLGRHSTFGANIMKPDKTSKSIKKQHLKKYSYRQHNCTSKTAKISHRVSICYVLFHHYSVQ